jgi:alkylated DNA repair dioxygenase AlkB
MNQSDKPKLKWISHFLSNPDELFIFLKQNVVWNNQMKSRKTASFGISYDYSGITYQQTKMPSNLQMVCENISKKLGFLPNNCLLNYYKNGNSTMGYHSDQTDKLQKNTGVVIISLGVERHISYKSKQNPEDVFQYLLKKGQLLYMDEKIQERWLHAIQKEENKGQRISLTFRALLDN